jgi:hypothetical protein
LWGKLSCPAGERLEAVPCECKTDVIANEAEPYTKCRQKY